MSFPRYPKYKDKVVGTFQVPSAPESREREKAYGTRSVPTTTDRCGTRSVPATADRCGTRSVPATADRHGTRSVPATLEIA